MAYLLSDDDPFDAATLNLAPEGVSLEEVIAAAGKAVSLGLRVCLPAAVVYVRADQTVDLQPLFKTRFLGQAPEDMAQLRQVPVLMPQGRGYRLSYPLQVGDTGLAVIADRNLDTWLASTGVRPADPQDDRAHDLSDAIFLPGLVPTAGQTTDTGSDLVLGSGSVTMRLGPSGTLNIKNSSQEILNLMLQTLQCLADTQGALASAQVLTSFGPAPFLASSIAQLQNLQAAALQLRANLQTFQSEG